MRTVLAPFYISACFFTVLACSSYEKATNMGRKVLFEHKRLDGLADSIEFQYEKDSLIGGIYNGVHVDSFGDLYFFESKFEMDKNRSDYDLGFVMKNFQIKDKNKQALQQSKFPFGFNYPINALGKYSGDSLTIDLLGSYYIGSKFDRIVFVKVPFRSTKNP